MPRTSLGKLKQPLDPQPPPPGTICDPRMLQLFEKQNYSSKPCVKFQGSRHMYVLKDSLAVAFLKIIKNSCKMFGLFT